jgi:hypothetical protein
MPPRVSVVLVAYRSGACLSRCLDSLAAQDAELEAIVVNNGPEGPEIREAERRPFVRVVRPGRNRGFGAGCNAGAREAVGDVLLFLNPDTVAAPGAVRELAATLDDSSVGIAMARLLLLHQPARLNSGGNVVHVAGFGWAAGLGQPVGPAAGEPREVPYASGAAMAMRAADFRALGGFTEAFFLYQEDVELSLRNWEKHPERGNPQNLRREPQPDEIVPAESLHGQLEPTFPVDRIQHVLLSHNVHPEHVLCEASTHSHEIVRITRLGQFPLLSFSLSLVEEHLGKANDVQILGALGIRVLGAIAPPPSVE